VTGVKRACAVVATVVATVVLVLLVPSTAWAAPVDCGTQANPCIVNIESDTAQVMAHTAGIGVMLLGALVVTLWGRR
jgi:hypothetical protein